MTFSSTRQNRVAVTKVPDEEKVDSITFRYTASINNRVVTVTKVSWRGDARGFRVMISYFDKHA